MKNKGIVWIALFTAIMVIAVSYLFAIASNELWYFGLPKWIYGFLLIELSYCTAMWLFITYYWTEDNE